MTHSTSGGRLYHEQGGSPVQEARRACAWFAGVFAALGVISGPRLDDDSYQHFAHSVQQVASLDWALWLTDLWNKPLPGLAYGVSGLLGLTAARMLAVGLSASTVYLTIRLCHLLLPSSRGQSEWIALAMASQLAFLKDAFVTMTEIPAALCLVLALYLQLARGRPWFAALALGCVPLCRVEMLPTCAFVAVYWAWPEKKLSTLVCAGLPCALWFGAAALATHDVTWFRQGAYASLRAWGISGLLRYNVLAGLAAVMSAPAVLLFFLGLIAAPRTLPRAHAWLVIGALACHYVTLNVLDVFPKGVEGVPRGHAVAAINARNYTCTAPLATLFICLGMAGWRTVGRRVFGWALACTGAALVLGRLGSPALLALDCALVALLFGCMRWPERAWRLAAISCMAGALLVRPFFWYPTRWNDQRALAIAALAARARAQAPARIVQDVASALSFFGQLHGIDADWTWPNEFPARLQQAPAPSWLVTEVDASGSLLTRYPAELHVCAQAALARYDSPAGPAWLNAIDRLAARNRPVHWRAYTVTPACRSQLR